MTYDTAYWSEAFDERAAILEHDGGLSRREAERRASTWIAIERLRVTSEQVQQREQATKPKRAEAQSTEQQQALPGFETAYAGG